MTAAPPKAKFGKATHQQLEFASIAFPEDRTVLYVHEVAARWRVSGRHIIDLLEEGKLDGFDIAGRHEYIRVPAAAIAELSKLTKLPIDTIIGIMTKAKPTISTARAHWRIPKEGYSKFIQENHSLAGGIK